MDGVALCDGGEDAAGYGGEVVAALGRQLATEFGRGFGEKNLRRMIQFAESFPDAEIVAALLRQLSWTHFTMLIPINEPLKRDFFAEMCRMEGWSTRVLRKKIDGMLYERTALSKKPEQLVRQELDSLRENDELRPDLVFQDPSLLDFLGLEDTYSDTVAGRVAPPNKMAPVGTWASPTTSRRGLARSITNDVPITRPMTGTRLAACDSGVSSTGVSATGAPSGGIEKTCQQVIETTPAPPDREGQEAPDDYRREEGRLSVTSCCSRPTPSAATARSCCLRDP